MFFLYLFGLIIWVASILLFIACVILILGVEWKFKIICILIVLLCIFYWGLIGDINDRGDWIQVDVRYMDSYEGVGTSKFSHSYRFIDNGKLYPYGSSVSKLIYGDENKVITYRFTSTENKKLFSISGAFVTFGLSEKYIIIVDKEE